MYRVWNIEWMKIITSFQERLLFLGKYNLSKCYGVVQWDPDYLLKHKTPTIVTET